MSTIKDYDVILGPVITEKATMGSEHGQVTFRHNALRDCLFASGLKRHLDSEWFERKNQPRRIEQRAG